MTYLRVTLKVLWLPLKSSNLGLLLFTADAQIINHYALKYRLRRMGRNVLDFSKKILKLRSLRFLPQARLINRLLGNFEIRGTFMSRMSRPSSVKDFDTQQPLALYPTHNTFEKPVSLAPYHEYI